MRKEGKIVTVIVKSCNVKIHKKEKKKCTTKNLP
jgi:hypothetical protein